MTEWGREMYVTPGIVVDGELVTTDLVDINLGIRILLGQLVLRRLAGRRDVRRRPTRSATRSTSATRGTRRRCRSRRSATSTGKYTWVMSPRWFDQRTGEHLALDTGGGPLARLWVTALAGRVDIGYVKATGQSVKIHLPEDGARCPRSSSSGRSRSGATRSSATARAPTSRPTPRPRRSTSSSEAWRRCTPGRTDDVDRVQGARRGDRLRLPRGGARRALAPRGHPRRQDRQLPPVPADAVERQPARLVRHARALRGRGAEHADLRGERARQLQGHRHHAHGAQLRPVPAVRRAHVPGRRQGDRGAPLADVRSASCREGARRCDGRAGCSASSSSSARWRKGRSRPFVRARGTSCARCSTFTRTR